MIQLEVQLEQELITRLRAVGWSDVSISGPNDLRVNLRRQIELHNEVILSEAEFAKILNHLEKGNVFDKAETLRSRFALNRDDGTTTYIQFLNCNEWCKNRYQVASQIAQTGLQANRYDVTLLINGLPVVQIELKRRGVELKEAFNQVNRYHRQSYSAEAGIFQYVQIFVISNGVNTKYYANNREQDFKQTFFWADADNNLITQLDAFVDAFLEKCHISKMIAKYIVLHQSDRVLMVLRPYQYYAVERISTRVKEGRKNGYIWHTTGSGKTLTSFKTAQLLIENPKVKKVVFVVDRADLDYQTTKEFNHFSEGSVDGTDNTKALVAQLANDTRLVVTTIQKLNTAITRDRYDSVLMSVKDERIVFIFDECHRSQFGETHKNIVAFFSKAQMFGFTGTPIFVDNSIGRRTTKDLFGECLHRYVITDAIRDENVLRFSVEYWGKLRRLDGGLIDEEVAGIDTDEFFENPDRIGSIVDWVIKNHDRKTRERQFGAIMCVASVDMLIGYYEEFKRRSKEGSHKLRIAAIFTTAVNDDDSEANGLISDPSFELTADQPASSTARMKLSEFVSDYNSMYRANESVADSKGFYTYYKNLAKRMKSRDKKGFVSQDGVDIVLVVNMFLTGFDAKTLNTLYVDKSLRYHGLIQAFSRTNRTLGQIKSQGNIVCFRNLKDRTDEAIKLFSDPDAKEEILLAPYEHYVEQLHEAVAFLKSIAPTPGSVDLLLSENELLAFVKAFRALIRVRNIMASFADFSPSDMSISPQEFEDYKSKYLDVHDRVKRPSENEKASIAGDLDFELELIKRDEINVAYILGLLTEKTGRKVETSENLNVRLSKVLDLLGTEAQLRSKKVLIEEFINKHYMLLPKEADVKSEFAKFWADAKRNAINELCTNEQLGERDFLEMMAKYQFTGKKPLSDEIISALTVKPSILKRKLIVENISQRLVELVEIFDDEVGSLEIATA